ncbi:hypothetical protein DEW08_10880 [Azospirillum thermophilum]|uniref:Uncharacterized protein n=1 Tax=Azospirillum thermophilum TaxID=2202148 RepID=A0A2S2CQ72_9PROT|nr:hypothetical protein DEW08_10880 [Azospirillum thermophilum]
MISRLMRRIVAGGTIGAARSLRADMFRPSLTAPHTRLISGAMTFVERVLTPQARITGPVL